MEFGGGKKLSNDIQAKWTMIDTKRSEPSIRRQCELIGLNRATLYDIPVSESELNLRLMHLIDEQYTQTVIQELFP